MARSKTNDTDQLTAQQLLEARVDAMMDPSAPTVTAGAPTLPGKSKVRSIAQPTPESTPSPVVLAPVADPIVGSEPEAVPEPIPLGPINIDTPQSDAAIDDIVAQEADQVLAAEDAGITAARMAAEAQAEPTARKRGHPIFWFLILLLATLAMLAAALLLMPSVTFAP